MKPFVFQKFTVFQDEDVFRVGTDAVLLGSLATVVSGNILEVGCGTGIISLMLAQRNENSEITAIDINPKAVSLASLNFENSLFKNRLKGFEIDFKAFVTVIKFNQILSNPPYFPENSSEKDVLARQQKELLFLDLIQKTSENITDDGVFSVILPSEACESFIEISKVFHLNLFREINIYGIEGGSLKRKILEFSKIEKPFQLEEFTIEKSPRIYSGQYLEATKDFHVFTKK